MKNLVDHLAGFEQRYSSKCNQR